jgi:5-methylthioadenosine/S-adenosylhomocysteine deaminase
MPADRVFEMATLGGAHSIGMESELGSLEAGKRADLVVLRRDRLHLQPQESIDPYAQLVYEHRASDVDTVVVDGRVLVREGALVELEEGEIRARANESASRVLERVAAGDRA